MMSSNQRCRMVPRSPAEIFAAGEHSDVPLMAGWNRDEGFNFTLLQGDDAKRPYADLARAIFNERTEALLQHYPAGSPETDGASARTLGGDLVIIHPTWAWIEAQKENGRAGGVLRAHQKVVTADGEGEITSGTFSPSMQESIAFARVPASVKPGDKVHVVIRDKKLPASVVKLPFVRNGKVLAAL